VGKVIEAVVEILEPVEDADLLEHYARQAVQLTLEATGAAGSVGGVGIVLAGSAYVRELNQRYRGEPGDTDVLAFPMEEPGSPDIFAGTSDAILGDVIISLPTASSQAEEYGHPLAVEVALLVSHGILHLLGYDDQDASGEEGMWEKQREVLARLTAPTV
jgi:probable rRNA maturation factor